MLEVRTSKQDDESRLKAVYVSMGAFLHLFSKDLRNPSKIEYAHTSDDIPDDAELVGIHLDPHTIHTVVLIMRSPQFPLVEPGNIIPELRVMLRATPIKFILKEGGEE